MQDPYFRLMRDAISDERLEAYRVSPTDVDADLLERYLWNLALCEALYPVLQSLEVSLRNTVHNALSASEGSARWYDTRPSFLSGDEQAAVAVAESHLASQGKPLDPGRVVAELRFGFWTALFDRRYERRIRPLLKDMFPAMPRRIRNHRTLTSRLNQVRRLRNRVFHHESITRLSNLPGHHRNALETIGWINPTLRSTIDKLDRFPSVHGQGSGAYRRTIDEVLRQRARSRKK